MTVPQDADFIPDPAPDAAVDGETLHCPLCGYSLRGLPEPRCPECGYAFTWAGLRDEMRRREAWFYEHARTRRAFWLTRWRSLRPRKFWGELKPAWTINTERLHAYNLWSIGFTIGILAVFCVLLPILLAAYNDYAQLGSPISRPLFWPLLGLREGLASMLAVTLGIGAAVAFCLTHAFWLVLSWSTTQRAIRPQQLLRASVYILDPLPWMLLAASAWVTFVPVAGWEDFLGLSYFLVRPSFPLEFGFLLTVVAFAILGYRVGVASHKYLHLQHAAGIGLAYFGIMGLMWFLAFMYATVAMGF